MFDDDEIDLGNVADFDQHHAEALDMLRSAETFLLAVPQVSEEEGRMAIVMTGGGVLFPEFKRAVSAGLNAEAWADIEDWLRRDRWLRRVLITAATVNVVLVCVNLTSLIR